ncbi:NAD-binding protein [Pigmentiphaga litoralis]|uniref:3-hydroxyisobutyrate dehydrogenase n=1 Tax=Pigmentiphaga litoralis TaxID=516702 RepID=A0A7Y9IUE1_9BURK|nr:NAD-binding protein [Pigmentiphaga litoralis]NYE23158.1 3-hydroxyisobutyrate dehydrogenase [Pigmentiphaga litoralis]NYE83227.1 3-hydroxyisobutyrate dehydrogenase [Pigmentiphaga litoralis]
MSIFGDQVGDGQAIKAVNDVMSAACHLLTLEVVAMGRKAGLSMASMITAINQSSGRSRFSEVALPALLAGKPSSDVALSVMIRDVDQAIALGIDAHAPMPIAAMTRALLQMGMNTVGPDARLDDMVDVIGNLAGTSLRAPDKAPDQVSHEVVHDAPATSGVDALPADAPGLTAMRAAHGALIKTKPVIGYIGLGAMGHALARQALNAASELHVYDVDPARVDALVQLGAKAAPDLATLASACDVIMLCVPGAHEVRATLFGDGGMAPALRPGTIIVDQSTGSPALTRALAAELAALGVALVDAPVAGGPKGASDGSLLSLCGGEQSALATVQALLGAMGSQVMAFGGPGNGHAAKLIKNALGACNRLITYESVSLAVKLGLDLDVLRAVIEKSSGCTAAFSRIVPNLRSGAPTAQLRLELLAKDLRLITQMAADCGTPAVIPNVVRGTVESAVGTLGKDANIDELARLFDLHVLSA